MAERLRDMQRQFGTAAVRSTVLILLGQHQSAGLPDPTLAKKLDVHPALVALWRAEEEREQLARLSVGLARLLARELAKLEQSERLASQKLSDPKTGSKTWAAAMAVLNQVTRQRIALLREAGSVWRRRRRNRRTTPAA
jgi:hypothetical protein